MKEAILRLELLSATTFGRGDGVAGLVDSEVEHDSNGFPFLRGRTLKGLLFEAAENLVFALSHQNSKWIDIKEELFGRSGSNIRSQGILHISNAQIPNRLRTLIIAEHHKSNGTIFHKDEVLNAFTAIRRQTAMNPFGSAEDGSLRSLRVVLRETILEAILRSTRELKDEEWALLTGATLALRSAGTGRNRGRGRLRATIENDAFMRKYFALL